MIARSAALVRGVAFWVAALLPFSYVPLLQSAAVTVPGFAKLALLNVVALLVGHGYGSSDRSTEDRDRYRG